MTCAPLSPIPEAAKFRRSPNEVMRLSRLGASHPTRLSFLRILLRRMQREAWVFDRPLFDFDELGVGRAVYTARGPERSYSIVVFGHDLSPDMRSDRVIATAWDTTFCLFDGVPDNTDLQRLAANVPYQEAGRVSCKELTLSRANRSVRLFEHVVAALSHGEQPNADQLAATGYLMRTTAVYGSGKFGAASHDSICSRSEMSSPFQAEMLSVWLIRSFTVDLVEHMADCRARKRGRDTAVKLDPDLKRSLGVGNSTGLGMAPFLVRHPVLLNNWMMVREEALARIRSQATAGAQQIDLFKHTLSSVQDNATQWTSAHPIQVVRLEDLRKALANIAHYVETDWDTRGVRPWDALWCWGTENLPEEGQEALLSAVLEPHGELIDGLTDCLSANEDKDFSIDGAMPIGTIKNLLSTNYKWALQQDYSNRTECARFWYVSEDKLEPRLGERFDEPGSELELPLDIGRQASELWAVLSTRNNDEPIAHLLLEHPEHRTIVRRVQITQARPFAEIRDNLIASDLLPIDMLRCKLACFGATRFDPRSDRWVRISLFQNCPYPSDLSVEIGL